MNDIVRWDEQLAKAAKEVASLERPSISQISTKSGVMTYQNSPVPGNKMEVIIIASAFENRYYNKRFDPNKREPPKCFALSITGEEMIPHEDVKEKEAESCAVCPMGQWGSDPSGGKGKACKNVRRLGLLPAGTENIKTAELALISIPVTSAKNWANYVNLCAAEYSRPPWALKTEISIVPDAKTQFAIKFKTTGFVEDGKLGEISQRINSVQEVLLTPYDQSGEIEGSYPGESKKDRKF